MKLQFSSSTEGITPCFINSITWVQNPCHRLMIDHGLVMDQTIKLALIKNRGAWLLYYLGGSCHRTGLKKILNYFSVWYLFIRTVGKVLDFAKNSSSYQNDEVTPSMEDQNYDGIPLDSQGWISRRRKSLLRSSSWTLNSLNQRTIFFHWR